MHHGSLTKFCSSSCRFARGPDPSTIPPRLHEGFGAWVGQVLRLEEGAVVRAAGVDAAVYLKTLRMGEA
jgi:hypothetical protein